MKETVRSKMATRAQLQATLNVVPAHTWYAAPSGGLTFVNRRTADYLGLPKDHALRFGVDIGAQWDAHIPLSATKSERLQFHLFRRWHAR
jgi:PAS domain-containing protein